MSVDGDQVITDVWEFNMVEELDLIYHTLAYFPYVFIDTEFPGTLVPTPQGISEDEYYKAVKYNVDNLKLVQLGVTLSDGKSSCTWQFNFKEFDPEVDPCSKPSVELLRKSGLDFVRNQAEGVDASLISMLILEKLIKGCDNTKWVSFHGLYDLAYMIKLVYRSLLPDTLSDFLSAVSQLFGKVYDIKCMARACGGAYYGEAGLVKLSKILKVKNWTRKPHQAGHDSLITAIVFWELKRRFHDFHEDAHVGKLYGVKKHGG